MGKTGIEWATDVWNPVTGCTKVSQGCRNCYAERIAERFWGERAFADVRCHPERLSEPLKWRKPRRVFVNSMSDLFHPAVPRAFIHQVFDRMAITPMHTYLILTKRPGSMLEYFGVHDLVGGGPLGSTFPVWPLPNVWLGVSVEDQKTAEERIPLLLEAPAAVHFVSCEPLLGPVKLARWFFPLSGPRLDWVICGGESGPGARPMHPDWARWLRDQCQDAEIPYFFKQWGEWSCLGNAKYEDSNETMIEGDMFERVGKKKAGRELDGRTWDEVPGGD